MTSYAQKWIEAGKKTGFKEGQLSISEWAEEWFDNKRTNNDMWRMNQDELTGLFLDELKSKIAGEKK